jgi:hypothetical protein
MKMGQLAYYPNHKSPNEMQRPVHYVIDPNLKRRHLDTSQRAMVAARVANLLQHVKKGAKNDRPHGLSSEPQLSQDDASRMLNVGTRTVRRANRAIKECIPEIVTMVDDGSLTVGAASEVAQLSKEEQVDLVVGGAEVIADKAKELTKEKGGGKGQTRRRNGGGSGGSGKPRRRKSNSGKHTPTQRRLISAHGSA